MLRHMRKDFLFQPKGVYILINPLLNSGEFYYNLTGWAGNHTTASGSWFPTDLFRDDYYGTSEDLFNNLTARFPNRTFYELHVFGASAGLLFTMAIEKSASIDPATIRDALRVFNNVTSYGPVSWLQAGELSSAAWQCLQNYDKTVLGMICVHVNVRVCKCTFVCARVRVRVRMRVHVCVHVRACVHAHVYACACVCVHVRVLLVGACAR